VPWPASRSASPMATISSAPALVPVAVEARRREPERAVGQGATAEVGHRGDVRGRGIVVAAIAHHVVAQGDVGHLRADVDAVRRVDGVEVLTEALPAPLDALVQRRAGDVFDGLHQGDELTLGARAHRREADAAVAHHHGGHPVPRRRRDLLVPAHLTVEVGVDVDETRRHQLALGVDDALRRARHIADLGDPPVADGDAGGATRRPRPVDDEPVQNVQIVHDCPLALASSKLYDDEVMGTGLGGGEAQAPASDGRTDQTQR